MKELGHNVIAVDVEPERFKKILEYFDIPSVRQIWRGTDLLLMMGFAIVWYFQKF